MRGFYPSWLPRLFIVAGLVAYVGTLAFAWWAISGRLPEQVTLRLAGHAFVLSISTTRSSAPARLSPDPAVRLLDRMRRHRLAQMLPARLWRPPNP